MSFDEIRSHSWSECILILSHYWLLGCVMFRLRIFVFIAFFGIWHYLCVVVCDSRALVSLLEKASAQILAVLGADGRECRCVDKNAHTTRLARTHETASGEVPLFSDCPMFFRTFLLGCICCRRACCKRAMYLYTRHAMCSSQVQARMKT